MAQHTQHKTHTHHAPGLSPIRTTHINTHTLTPSHGLGLRGPVSAHTHTSNPTLTHTHSHAGPLAQLSLVHTLHSLPLTQLTHSHFPDTNGPSPIRTH